ncbi:hypothetical protein EI94DRAFT_1771828 [Lactarius quietus]|nr:hypothetical protein EI94DRAFT_1771828 [Lactarius quietus]
MYAPFASQVDWEVAKWAKMCGPSSTSFTGVDVPEQLGLSFKNTWELNQIIDTHLPGHPPFQQKEIVVGGEVCELYFCDIIQCICALFKDPDLAPHLKYVPERHYNDEDREERVYHDMYTGTWWWSTQVMVEKVMPGAMIVPSVYPIYMTIGNIPKQIRCYLPTTNLEQETNKAKQKCLGSNLYHAWTEGAFMSMATGNIHQVHPIFASFIGDYPKQVLTACTLSGDCPRCGTTRDNLSNFDPDDVPAPLFESFQLDPAGFLQACSQICAKPIPHPFWLDLPYSNVFCSITPNGVIKHLKKWILSACDPSKIDTSCHWISSLLQLTGHKHDQICCIHLPNHLSNMQFIWSAHALLDFLYLAQYPIHSYSTLQLLKDALSCFHTNREIFVTLGIHTGFNILKLHNMIHYIESIRYLGTTDNFNTQFTKRLHIDYAKDLYAATNHKDEAEQMTSCLDRKECIHWHEQHIQWQQGGLDMHWELSMTKHPTLTAVHLDQIQDLYRAPLFKVVLRRFISSTNDCKQTRQELESSVWKICFPFFVYSNPLTGACSTANSVHVKPARHDRCKQLIPGCFDTALINDGTGMEQGIKGYHIGHIRVVFSIPTRYHNHLFDPAVVVLPHLAYVQWYLRLTEPDPNHGMFKICPQKDSKDNWICSIVPLPNIQWSTHLIPRFGPVASAVWTSSNVLDRCNSFYLNTYSDRQMFCITTM